MPKTVKYIGTVTRWPELATTGKQSTWVPGQQEERSDTEAAKLLATGLFSDVDATQLPEQKVVAISGVVSGDGLGIAEYAAQWEAAIAQAMRLRAPTSLPTIPETQPALMGGNTYYIDPLNPSASNAGTGLDKTAPWATLDKLSTLNPGAGAMILLAADADYTLAEDWATYKAHGTVGRVDIGNMRGTITQPITIKPYHPRAWLYRAGYQPKPVIRWYADTAAGDWTQEAGYGGKVWSIAWTRSTFTKREALVFFGTSRRMGLAPGHDTDTPDRLTRDYQYVGDGTKIYVYVPDGTNPVAYYGAMRITGANAIFQTFWNGGHYVRFYGLRFESCYPLKVSYASNSATDLKGLEVAYCEFDQTIPIFWANGQTNATAREFETSVHDCLFTNLPHCGIRQSPTTGTSGNTHSWQVYRNIVRTANLSQSYGAGLVYNQSIGGTNHHAWGNYGYDCRNGAGTDGQPGGYVSDIDGSFIYNDIQSNTAVVWGNIAERCGVAFQFNRAVAISYVGNLAIDCATMLQATASGGSEINKSLHVAHNTWLWTGRIKLTDLQAGKNIGGTGVQDWTQWPVFEISNEQAGNNSNVSAPTLSFQQFTFVNNLAINASGTAMPTRSMMRWPENRTTVAGTLIAGNGAAGLSSQVIQDRGSSTDRTFYGRYVALQGDSLSGQSWVADYLRGIARPAAGSPLVGAGEPLNVTYRDIGGRSFPVAPAQPTIGCYEVNA